MDNKLPVRVTVYKRRILQYVPLGQAFAPLPPPAFGALTAPIRPSGKFMMFEVNQ